LSPEIQKRITNANTAYYALLSLLRSQSVLTAEKIKIYKSLIRPMTTYGNESCALTKDITKWLAIFEPTVLRRILG
jgi:hypothetical protein